MPSEFVTNVHTICTGLRAFTATLIASHQSQPGQIHPGHPGSEPPTSRTGTAIDENFPMISRDDLLQEFDDVESDCGCYFFHHDLPGFKYHYCLRGNEDQDLLVVSRGTEDRRFASSISVQAPASLPSASPTVFELRENRYGFSHAMAVPNTYHGNLMSQLEEKRERLFLCVPIFRCEFSGDESADEFRDAILRTVAVFDWGRDASPKIKVYFDNPKTGGGTQESGAIVRFATLLAEIENLSGVVDGFIEITNYKGDVVEVLSAKEGAYTLIRNRKDEEEMDLSSLNATLNVFVSG
jgi:hypothetical protein